MLDKIALKEEIIRILAPIPYISFAYLFGSQAGDSVGILSDVDIAVFFDEAAYCEGEPYGPECQLIPDLERALRKPVDLVALNKASLLLRYQVLKKGELLFSHSEKDRIRFHEETIRSYLDFLPFRIIQNEYLKKRIVKGVFGR